MTELNRRKVLLASGTAVTVGLAGCIGGGGGDSDGNGNGNGNGDDSTPQEQVESHLDGANNYDGSISDETGSDSVTIEVGAGDNGLAFNPAAVRVSSGTEITWEWTGQGGDHNVNVTDGPETFQNDEGVLGEEGHTYSRELTDTGAYLYQCDPHAASGMKGGIIVEE